MADGARTHDHWNHNPGLYQLSYSHRSEKKQHIHMMGLTQQKTYQEKCGRVIDCPNGAPGRIRTCDHPLRRRVLYPAELRAHAGTNLRRFDKKWSEWRDSNPRHSAPKTDALPGCATLRRLKTLCVSSGAHINDEI